MAVTELRTERARRSFANPGLDAVDSGSTPPREYGLIGALHRGWRR
jgi:hypothetical protein